MQVKEYRLKIKEIIDETPAVKTFRAEIPNGAGINFNSGQFFMVSMEDDKKLKRAYSISSSPAEKGHLDITLDKVGVFSTKLFNAKQGDELVFTGPYGKFFFTEDMKNNLVLIGGGTGIAPLMSIIRQCNDKKLGNKIKLLYSVRLPEYIIFKDDLEKIRDENPNFDYIVTVTRLPDEDAGWNGKTGRIAEALLRENIEDIEGSLYFLCGPNEFVKEIISMLEKLGAKKEQIKTDVWG